MLVLKRIFYIYIYTGLYIFIYIYIQDEIVEFCSERVVLGGSTGLSDQEFALSQDRILQFPFTIK